MSCGHTTISPHTGPSTTEGFSLGLPSAKHTKKRRPDRTKKRPHALVCTTLSLNPPHADPSTTDLVPRLHLLAEADARALVRVALPRGDAVAKEDAGVRLGDDDARARGAQGNGGVLCVWWLCVCVCVCVLCFFLKGGVLGFGLARFSPVGSKGRGRLLMHAAVHGTTRKRTTAQRTLPFSRVSFCSVCNFHTHTIYIYIYVYMYLKKHSITHPHTHTHIHQKRPILSSSLPPTLPPHKIPRARSRSRSCRPR